MKKLAKSNPESSYKADLLVSLLCRANENSHSPHMIRFKTPSLSKEAQQQETGVAFFFKNMKGNGSLVPVLLSGKYAKDVFNFFRILATSEYSKQCLKLFLQCFMSLLLQAGENLH